MNIGWSVEAVGIRIAIVVLAVLGASFVPGTGGLAIVVALAGSLAAAAAPSVVGALFLLGALVASWVLVFGTDGDPAPLRTVGFAVCAYLAYSATTLAAGVRLEAAVDRSVIVRWAQNCLLPVGTTVVAAVVVSLIGRTGGSLVLDVVGLLGAAAAVAGLVWIGRDRR